MVASKLAQLLRMSLISRMVFVLFGLSFSSMTSCRHVAISWLRICRHSANAREREHFSRETPKKKLIQRWFLKVIAHDVCRIVEKQLFLY